MRSTVSRVLGSVVVMTLAALVMSRGIAAAQKIDQVRVPPATVSPGVSEAPKAGAAAAGNPAAAPTLPDTKMTLEQVRAAMAAAQKRRQEAAQPDNAPSKQLTEKFGVKDFSIKRSAGGYMLDFRFRVVDAKKALPLFDHRIKPYLLAERSKIRLPVPMAAKVGAFRPTNRGRNIKADKTYYMIFGNPDSYVKSGQKVSVVIGEFRAEHLTVQ